MALRAFRGGRRFRLLRDPEPILTDDGTAATAEELPEETAVEPIGEIPEETVSAETTRRPRYHITIRVSRNRKQNFPARDAEEAAEKPRFTDRFKRRDKSEDGESLGKLKYLGGKLLMKMAMGGAALLRSNADEVNRLNVFPVPDGDTGDNMRMTIESGIAAIENLESDDIGEVMKFLSHGMLLGARGNSGVILSQFFAGTAKGFTGEDKADPVVLGHALELGVQQAYGSVMTPTEGTILTVAREAVEYAVNQITPTSTIRTFFADLVKEMHASLERTPEILTVLKEAGVVDSGGAGLLYIMDGFNRVLNGEEIKGDFLSDLKPAAKPAVHTFTADSEMTYGYCTELLVQITRRKADPDTFDIEPLKEFLAGIGDSIVAFKADGIVKIHVHTFTPDKVLAYCLTFGEFLTVKIENMSVQHTELSTDATPSGSAAPNGSAAPAEASDAPEVSGETTGIPTPTKPYGIVAVANGEGLEALLTELGTDVIVQGGQTQNPSTNDFLDAFRKVPAEHIFVFPNNGNILMAAKQAASLYDGAVIHVLPSKNVGTGYAAISAVDLSDPDPASVEAQMKEAMSRVTAGYVSPSIRDAEIGGVQIKKGDTIGVIEKEILVSEAECITAACKTADLLLSRPDKFMLTVFCGKDATPADRDALTAHLAKSHPDAEVYFIEGGQEIYPFLFACE